MNRALLEKPFETDEIKQREGSFGRILDYIEGHSVIQRLNDAFESKWSFTILEHKIIQEADEVLVLGELKAEDVVKSQFGSSKITRAKDSGEIISIADDWKAAATDCLKKTATMLGVALYLYRNGNGSKPKAEPAGQKSSAPAGENVPNTPAKLPERGAADGYKKGGNGGNNGNGRDRLTSKQMQFILSLAQDRNITRNELNSMTLDRYAVMCDFMNRAEASNFITELQSM
jgi:hypothetical protein